MPIFTFLFVMVVLPLTLFAGWVENIIWTFHQDALIPLILGIVGVFAAPIGALHGLYLFFA